MSNREERQKEALEELKAILRDDEDIKFMLVEGSRDVEALRFIGVKTLIDVCSHIGQAEPDIASNILSRTDRVLILTDFDQTGRDQAKRLTELLIAEGVHVQSELRRKIGKLMNILGLKTIESIDNWVMNKT